MKYKFVYYYLRTCLLLLLSIILVESTGCSSSSNHSATDNSTSVENNFATINSPATTDSTASPAVNEGNTEVKLEPIASNTPQPTPSPVVTTSITISAAGDCTFGSDQGSPANVNFYSIYNKKKNDGYFFKNVKKYFSNDDMTIVNFEGTLTTSNSRVDKTYAFKGDPSYVNILKQGSIEAVAFANNHCRDYGEKSYTDTITAFKNAGIKYSSFDKVSTYKVKGKCIGMIAVDGLNGIDYCKTLIDSGMKKLKKKKADLIIVSMHAGIEHTNVLNSVQTDLAHYAVKKGANLVLGHHPHTLQGIEKYKGAYIVYSLANFCFGGNTNPADKDTIIYQQTFTFEGNKLKKDDAVHIIPCRISSTASMNDYQPTPLKGSEGNRIIQNMNSFSSAFNISFAKNGRIK